MSSSKEAQHTEEKAATSAVQPSINYFNKENIDPLCGQHSGSGLSVPGPFVPLHPVKQQSSRSSSSKTKGRRPLADITALCMLQASLPHQAQQSAGSSSALQGFWGTTQTDDKVAGSSASGGVLQGRRLATMR